MNSFAFINVPRIFLIIQSCILSLFGTSCFAQLQNNNWTFGNGCRVNFNSPVPNGALNSLLFSSEPCATVSNPETGSLLFYSDGLTVWGSTNQPMPNGTGLLGGAQKSSTQGPTIVPFPENPDKYFVFTIDELEFDAYTGLHYSVVDMTLNIRLPLLGWRAGFGPIPPVTLGAGVHPSKSNPECSPA